MSEGNGGVEGTDAIKARSERREEIKLHLEYAKLAATVLGLALIVMAVLQWRIANEQLKVSNHQAEIANTAAAQAVYQRMSGEWRDHIKMFLERPELRRYFANSAPLPLDEKERQAVLAMADVRLDAMDGILTYAGIQGQAQAIQGWRNTFASAFRNSVVLCERLRATEGEYGFIVPIAKSSCGRVSMTR